jgi:hypothetical protein
MHALQYEDPTDVVQSMRERIELQRAWKAKWLVELARRATRSAAVPAAANGTANSHQVFHFLLICAYHACSACHQCLANSVHALVLDQMAACRKTDTRRLTAAMWCLGTVTLPVRRRSCGSADSR